MNNEEAKFILHAYRPDGSDAGDPAFHAALEQARRDPVLEKWFAAQQAFDRAVCARLGGVAPPSDLREAILTGARFGAIEEAPTGGGSPADQRRRSAWPAWLGLAAGLAVLLAVGLALWPKEAEARSPLLDFALDDTLRQAQHGQHGREVAEFQALLGGADTRLTDSLTVDFESLRRTGCRTVYFDGRPVLEVCFNRDGKWFHCYIARVNDFPAVAPRLRPTFRDEAGASAVAWADGNYIYIVASKAGRQALETLI